MAKRESQTTGTAAPSKSIRHSSPNGTGMPAPDDASRIRELVQKYNERLREIHERVLDEGIESVDLYGFDNCRVLEGDELIEGLRRYDGVSLIQERVIEIQELKPVIDRVLAMDQNEADAKSLLDEQVWLKGILVLNGLSLLRCLRNTAYAMGLDPTPFTIVHENLTTETRAQALAIAELMALKAKSLPSTIGVKPSPFEELQEPAITMSMEIVMRTMQRFDASRLLTAAAITEELETRLNVETVRRAVVALEACHYVERPEGPRRGCRLTRIGRLKAGKIEA